MKRTETDLVAAVLRLCALMRIFAWRQNNAPIPVRRKEGRAWIFTGFRKTLVPGLPDVVGVLPGGRALFIECKAVGGKVRPEQHAFLQRAEAEGAMCLFVRDVETLHEDLKVELTRNPRRAEKRGQDEPQASGLLL